MMSSLLHLVGLRPRVYYTLTNFRGGGGGGKAPLAPPSIRQCKGPPSGQFLRLQCGGPQISFFAYYMWPLSSQFLSLLYGGLLHVSFFDYYLGIAPMSVSSLIYVWGTLTKFLFSIFYALKVLESYFSCLFFMPK